MFDRDTTNIAKTQIGFLDFIIKPTFELVVQVLPHLSFTLNNIENNKKNWTERFDEYEKIKEAGNKIEDKIERKFPVIKYDDVLDENLASRKSMLDP
jgi:hypothetical protein